MTILKNVPHHGEPLFSAIITEEKSGRRLPKIPIKLLGQNPEFVGKRVASLLVGRFQLRENVEIEVMAQGRLVAVPLASSYLMISLVPPCESLKVPNRAKAFTAFTSGLKTSLKHSGPISPLTTKPNPYSF